MTDDKLEKLYSLISKEKTGWLEKARWREENEDWLDLSFEIAVKILGALRKNKESDTFPKTQKELADAMGCTPQYINKVLKGHENLQLETISKLGNILDLPLIEVPKTPVPYHEIGWSSFDASDEELISKIKIKIKPFFNSSKFNKAFIEKKEVSYFSLSKRFNSEEDFDKDYTKVGKHRRSKYEDIMPYKNEMTERQKKHLIEIIRSDEELGLYDS